MSQHEDDDNEFDPRNPICPQCGGAMWDNRADNAEKGDGQRRPDFRCKSDRDHVIWPPREKKGKGGAAKKGPKDTAKRAYSVGDLPGDPGEGQPARPAVAPVAAPAAAPRSPLDPEALKEAELARRVRICARMKTAISYFGDKEKGMLSLMSELDIGYTAETTQALITTLFIALNDQRIP